MTNIQKVLTSRFGSLEIDVVQAGQAEPGVTREQLGEMLEYANPAISIGNIHNRNRDRLDPFSVLIKMINADGKSYDTYVYGFKGILEVCRFSNQPNAHAVMDWAWETLDRIRKGDGVVKPTGMALVQEAMQFLIAENTAKDKVIENQQLKIAADAPKVDFAGKVGDCTEGFGVRELALKFRQNGADCELLFIDDLLKEKATSGELTEADIKHLFAVIDTRYDFMRPTIITTECTSGRLESLNPAIYYRMAERAYAEIIFEGEENNYRKRL